MEPFVIGAGILGKAVSDRLECPCISRPEFDLKDFEDNWRGNICFISAAVTSQKECEDNPENAWFINVTQTTKLINQLKAKNIHVVFPSTNLAANPNNVYSKTKAEIEKIPGITVIRLPKVLDKNSGIIKEWKSSEEIKVFSNLEIAPISLSFATDYIVKLMKEKPVGIFEISGERVTYENLAKNLGFKKMNVETVSPTPVFMGGICSQPLKDVIAELK